MDQPDLTKFLDDWLKGEEESLAANEAESALIDHVEGSVPEDKALGVLVNSNVGHWLETRATRESNFIRYKILLEGRFENTCNWIHTESWYRDWLKGDDISTFLWLHAPSGAGKSTICAQTMNTIANQADSPAVIYQFFRFDEQTTADQLLCNIADQLYQYVEKSFNSGSDRYEKDGSQRIAKILRINTDGAANECHYIWRMIHCLIRRLPKVYIFLDGLDEVFSRSTLARQKEALQILDFMVELTRLFDHVRFWLTSGNRDIFRNRLQKGTTVDIQHYIKRDVDRYLCKVLPDRCSKYGLDEQLQTWIIEEVQRRTDGNFLCARLMLQVLDNSTNTDLKSFIQSGLPSNLDGCYKNLFYRHCKLPTSPLHSILFSLVVFAKRSLTVCEITSAISALKITTLSRAALNEYVRSIVWLFWPLVVVDHRDNRDRGRNCRLFHSTARTFLLKNPDIFQCYEVNSTQAPGPISEGIIAIACLALLSQPRHSGLLQDHTTGADSVEHWESKDGDDVLGQDPMLRYSSKYWNQHCDYVEDEAVTSQLREYLEKFLTSSNFVTTMQVQSLVVEQHFEVYTLAGMSHRYKWLKRVFPRWFNNQFTLKGGKTGAQFVKDYRDFVSEWGYFLRSPTCSSFDLPYAGEIDRCLWGALGPKSFLSNYGSRYESFMLANEQAPKGRLCRKHSTVCVDGFGQDGREFAMVHYSFEKFSLFGNIELKVESWIVGPGFPPKLEAAIPVNLNGEQCHWQLYLRTPYQKNKGVPIKFSPDLRFLRIGSKILARQINSGKHKWTQVLGASVEDNSIPWYFEEFAVRGKYIAVVARGKSLSSKQDENASNDESLGHDNDSKGTCVSWKPISFSGIDFKRQSTDEQINAPEDLSESDTNSDLHSRSNGYTSNSSLSSDPKIDKEPPTGGTEDRRRMGTIIVFDISQQPPKRIFQHTVLVARTLHDSLPIIHPTKPLVVWPIGGASILYADFMAGSHYVQEVSKCHPGECLVNVKGYIPFAVKAYFSDDGDYLHLAFLTAKRISVPKKSPSHFGIGGSKVGKSAKETQVALTATTHLIDPRQILHHTRICIGSFPSTSLSQIPVSLTWSPNHLYCSISGSRLELYRINLFRQASTIEAIRAYTVPKHDILLPDSSRVREVRYYPSSDEQTGTILVGSLQPKFRQRIKEMLVQPPKLYDEDLPDRTSPPIGLFVKEGDLGGWVDKSSKDEKLEKRCEHRQGLVRTVERPDAVDDCDMENIYL